MRKRPISLIEVIICLGLLATLVTTLLALYRSTSQQKEEMDRLNWSLMEERYAHQRLQTILPIAELPLFTTFDHSLVFIFDRGPYSDPLLSGKVLGRLYFDEAQHALCLGIWPLPNQEDPRRTPSQTLTLLEGVTACTFSFYQPPPPFKNPVNPPMVGTPSPLEGWQNEWQQAYHTLPALVKLSLTREWASKRAFEYIFDLPILVVYTQETG